MSIPVQCPNPVCKASAIVGDSFSGRNVKCKRCGTPFVAKPTFDEPKGDTKKGKPASIANPFPVLPAEFGRYRILRLLGKGGMGAVYLAQDTQLGRQVALKVPFFDAAASPQRAERFVREARSAAVLQHPNICTVYDAGQIDGRPFITMAYIAGTPLEKEIDPDAPMPQVRAAEVVRKIALALQHAHQTGIVHRDLKPANMMTASGGEPVVMDFGLAKRVADADPNEAKLTREGGLLGTPSYMAPEQVKGDSAAVGPATDVYALGVILFEMLTGRTPYAGGITVVIGQILAAPAPPVKEFRPDVDARLDAICRKAMAKEPAQRFASMAELAEALGQYLKAPSAPPPVAAVVKAPPPATAVRAAFDLEIVPAPVSALKKAKPNRILTALSGKIGRRRMLLMLAVALVALLPLLWWLAGSILRVETANGTLVVEMNDAETEARVKNGKLILTGPDDKVRYILAPSERNKRIEAGPYKIQVEGADGLSLDTSEFTLKKGDKVTVRVTATPKAAAAASASDRQATAVASDPDREAAEYVLSLGGTVLLNDRWDEIKAVGALPQATFQLSGVDLYEKQATDEGLAHFKECKNLKHLSIRLTKLTDAGLANFKNCKNLDWLNLEHSTIGDAGLASFKDCKNITTLALNGTQVTDAGLACFKDCADLNLLSFYNTKVTNAGLAYFKDCKRLRTLICNQTNISDLSPLKDMNLTHLNCTNTRVTDLSVLKGMPLRQLYCDFKPERDAAILRSLWTLETINGKPTAEFWKEVDANQAKVAPTTSPPAADNQVEVANSLGMKLKLIQPGTFLMGSPKDVEPAADNEQPQHEVEVTKPFYLGVYPVTKGQFAAFVKDSGYQTEAEKNGGAIGFQLATAKWESKPEYNWRNPGFPQTDDHPVVAVTWNDATAFCAWLSKKEGKDYVLPTEAEWEYACRAGTTTRYWCGDTDASLQGNANLADLSLKEKCPAQAFAAPWNDNQPFTSPAGAFKPNAWGLYDMAGNVWQWCADGYGKYAEGRVKDPQGAKNAEERVLRGGSWNDSYQLCSSAFRLHLVLTYRTSDLGFRVARQSGPMAVDNPTQPSPSVDPEKKEADDKGWVSLFNGKDLKGWKVYPSQPGNWRVVNGAIIVSGDNEEYLYTDRADYANFHLRFEVKPGKGDGYGSGIKIRAPFGPSLRKDAGKRLTPVNPISYNGGYRVLSGNLFIDDDAVMNRNHNADYGADEWVKYELIADGYHLVIKDNGQTACDYIDQERRYSKGHIALMAYAGKVVGFRNIEIKKLTPAKKPLVPAAQADDPFQPKSVWVNDEQNMTLTVMERTGEKFSASFVVDSTVLVVAGTVKDGKLSWLAKNVRTVKGGGTLADNQATITRDKDGDLLDFTWRIPGSGATGAYVLRLKPGK